MNIALLGYGRMGRTIEKLATGKGHKVTVKISSTNAEALTPGLLTGEDVDVAIDFSLPTTALKNISTCFLAGIPVVSGTTAWLQDWDQAIANMKESDGSFLYASNFSVGVNLFFALNEKLAQLMNNRPEYTPNIHEVHHTGKLDAPSGTAITLGKGLVKNMERLTQWSDAEPDESTLLISSERIDPAPGTHHVKYTSPIDDIELIHTAKSRDGFALGAILAAEYLQGKKGLHTMADVLKL